MTTIQKLFVLSLCAFLVLCSSNSYAQTALGTDNFERKHLSTISHDSTVPDTPTSTPDPTHPTLDPTHPTYTPDPTGASATGDANLDGRVDASDLANGMNVIAETREGGLLAVVMEKGRLVDMGTIDPDGTFYKFEQENKCKDFFANPCRDGSKPSVFFDPYLKKCVGVCDVIDLDPVAYNPINPYGLRPNGPCSDYIVQPCRKGEYLVMYYDPYKKVCVAYCEY